MTGRTAGKEIAVAASIAVAAIAAVPAHANALAGFPSGNAWADGINHADDFMAGNARILDAGP